jgi:hypothetical protein
MSWTSLQSAEPLIAHLGEKLLRDKAGIAFLATTRADGSPRVHPVCPLLTSSELLLCLIGTSPKSADLKRDPRCVLHALPGPGNAEFWVEAVAEAQSANETARLALGVPEFRLPDGDTLFRLDISAAHATIFRPGPDSRPLPDRRHWSRARSVASRAAVRAGA